jgi:proteasome lid subunit RPN8/RPN11
MEDFIPKDDDFTPHAAPHPALLFVARPAGDPGFETFAARRDGFEAYVHRRVLDAISREAAGARPNETIGLLAGRVRRDEKGPYTLVLAAEGARADELKAGPSHVHISAGGHSRVRRRLEETAHGLDIIGWYHSHPLFTPRFSSVDMTEQSTWPDPNHIGIVVSGLKQEEVFGVYRGPKATLLVPARSPRQDDEDDFAVPDASVVEKVLAGDFAERAAQPATATQPARAEGALQTPAALDAPAPVRTLPARRFLLPALALVLLAAGVVWLDRRLRAIEGRLAGVAKTVASEGAVPATPRATPSPAPAQDAAEVAPAERTPTPPQVAQPPAEYPAARANPRLPIPPLSNSPKPARAVERTEGRKANGKANGKAPKGGTKAPAPGARTPKKARETGTSPARESTTPAAAKDKAAPTPTPKQ